MNAFSEFLKRYWWRIDQEKAAAGWLSQDGTLYYTARLLDLREISGVLRDRYRFLLVDEYQDTNSWQHRSSRLSEDQAPHSGLALPFGIEVDDLKREHLSRSRNPLIAEVFCQRGLLRAGDAASRRPLNYASAQAEPNLSSPGCQW